MKDKGSRWALMAIILILFIVFMLPASVFINVYWVPPEYHHVTGFIYAALVVGLGGWLALTFPEKDGKTDAQETPQEPINDNEQEETDGQSQAIESAQPVEDSCSVAQITITAYKYREMKFGDKRPSTIFEKILDPKWQLPSGILPVITEKKPTHINMFSGKPDKLEPDPKKLAITSGKGKFSSPVTGELQNAEWISILSAADVLEAYVTREQATCPHGDKLLRLDYDYQGRYYCYGDDGRNDLTVIGKFGLECKECGALIFIDSRFEQCPEERGPWWGYADVYLLSMKMWDYFMEKYHVPDEERSKVPVKILKGGWSMAD